MDNENKYKQVLIETSGNIYKGYKVLPCGTAPALDEGLTWCGMIMMFRFNTTKDNSTGMVHSHGEGIVKSAPARLNL